MKYILFLFFTLYTLNLTAQVTGKPDGKGNVIQVAKPAKTEAELIANCTKDSRPFIDSKEQSHTLYITEKGKFFILKVSKTGKPYRSYVTIIKE